MVKVGSHSKWGVVESVAEVGPGVHFVSTTSHGGYKLDKAMNGRVPVYMRREGGWYEEDCEWSVVALVFPDLFPEETHKGALDTLRNWFPDQYEQFTGEAIAEGESHVRDREIFRHRHKGDFIAVAAWGDWKEGVPPGMVGVLAAQGGVRGEGAVQAYFLVPADEYAARGPMGFVVDLDRHRRTAPIGG